VEGRLLYGLRVFMQIAVLLLQLRRLRIGSFCMHDSLLGMCSLVKVLITVLRLLCRRQRQLRADSYRALRLLDLALTAWTSVWTESQELAQKASFILVGRQAELKVLVLREWQEQAVRLKLKRERLEM
jgi:hypothetical protein